jgi:hypothetical protein
MDPVNIPLLMEKVDALYEDAVKRGKPFTKLSATRDKIVAERGWKPAASYIDTNFDRVLTEFKVIYVPKVLSPGPMFLFPIMDTEGEINYAQTKPLLGSPYYGKKYYRLGIEPTGPQWLGNSMRTIRTIVETGVAGLVEGPFDWLACKLLSPDSPVLCPLTKRIGKDHQAYLRLLGIHTLYFMYDNEADLKGYSAARNQSRDFQAIPMMKCHNLPCPAPDPSEALKNYDTTQQLKTLLKGLR